MTSGQPVEWSADKTTGTPATRAARRPQNILSPAPTVTTASIRWRRKSRSSRPSTATSNLPRIKLLVVGISCESTSPSGPSDLRQASAGRKRSRSIRRTRLTNSVSAPPTGIDVIKNITRSGPRSSSGAILREQSPMRDIL